MAARGRPTPQPEASDRPRFRDRAAEDYANPNVNPYVRSHRTFGPELLTADEAWTWRGRWGERFGREAPLHVDLGSGNGFFLSGLARDHAEYNVLGIELRYKRTVMCAKKIRVAGLKHALVARYHAAYLDDLFVPGALCGITVNHPDPWPKQRHDKHRLISRWFLEDVCWLLRPGGWLRVKSDYRDNVDRIARLLGEGPEGEALERLPLEITGRSEDVTDGSAPWPGDIETNYQRKFREKGLPVYAIEVVRN